MAKCFGAWRDPLELCVSASAEHDESEALCRGYQRAPHADAQIPASTTGNLAAALAGDRIGVARASVAAKSAAYEKACSEGSPYQEPAGLRLVEGRQ